MIAPVTSLRIREATTFEELQEWRRIRPSTLLFQVRSDSSFAFAAEGTALGLLGELQRTHPIEVECSIDILGEHRSKGLAARLGIFDSLFGLALVSAARSFRLSAPQDVRSKVLECLWERVREGRGEIGDGKHRALVSRDPDEPVPECLRAGETRFPRRDQFATVLFQQAKKLGAGGPTKSHFSRSEDDAITFIYEAARNSFEHARTDEHGVAVRGVRGVLLEKLRFVSKEEALSRKGLSPLQRDYVGRIWPDLASEQRAVAYSVVDLGPGIHRTLKPTTPGESPWDRLERAFQPGETRKAKGTDVEAGMGLPKLYEAATRLRALLMVRSGSLLAVADFSKPRNDVGRLLTPLDESVGFGDVGTSLTLLWPELRGGSDQGKLF